MCMWEGVSSQVAYTVQLLCVHKCGVCGLLLCVWFSGLTSSGAHAPISIDSHPTLEDINQFVVCEVPSSATISGAPTTDGKQLSSVPIPKESGAATPHHDDPTPPTSAGECLPQCMSECILYFHLLRSMGCLLGEGEKGTDTALSSH